MGSGPAEATKRTSRCLQSIKGHTDPPARVVFICGKEGVGKSSLTEKIARVTGLSGHGTGTKTCQIVDTEINGNTYFIVDTPGFHDEASQLGTFCDIAGVFDEIHGHAIIAGILFATPINTFMRRPGTLEQNLYTWLTELCGETFFPNLTFVITFWESQFLVQRYNQRLKDRKETCYPFGKKYVAGEETGELLLWEVDTDELSDHARDLVIRRCRNQSSAVEPLFLQELNAGVLRDATSAAQVFRPGSPRSTPNTSNNSHGDTDCQSQQPNTETPGNPTATNGQPPTEQESLWWTAGRAFGNWFGNAVLTHGPRIAEYVINRQFGGGGGGGGGGLVMRRNGGPQAMAERGLDINSSADTFRFMGLDSSFDSRARYYREFGGPGTFTGSAANGDWLLSELWRRAKD
ncbi:hypothetical protein BJY01DRAFT_238737 [Aspergillus pseudoustus]|uniref:G domain-containing protein n=1 Tax=Aspergillus pseudoustus TaxID=1810923 RepID=A0ABR4J687_9EURO